MNNTGSVSIKSKKKKKKTRDSGFIRVFFIAEQFKEWSYFMRKK